MSYAIPQDIKDLFRDFPDTTNAAVDDVKLERFILNASNVVDARLKGIYLLPITQADNPASYSILNQIVSFKVAGIVDDILNNYSEADKKPTWDKKADTLLNDIAPALNKDGGRSTPNNILPDAVFLGTTNTTATLRLSSTDSPIFTKGGKNW